MAAQAPALRAAPLPLTPGQLIVHAATTGAGKVLPGGIMLAGGIMAMEVASGMMAGMAVRSVPQVLGIRAEMATRIMAELSMLRQAAALRRRAQLPPLPRRPLAQLPPLLYIAAIAEWKRTTGFVSPRTMTPFPSMACIAH